MSPRVWKPQAAIFNRRLSKVGDFKSPLLVLRHPRTKNNAPRFQIPRNNNRNGNPQPKH
jgi:hypothetical protein